jgi:5'-nucleotidase
MKKGSFAKFLMMLSKIQKKFSVENFPIRTALVTTRSPFGANIFFDDQDVHLELSSGIFPSAKIMQKNIEKRK